MLNFKTRIERLPKLQKFLPRLKAQVKGLPFCNTREKIGDRIHIKITDGFSGSINDKLACMDIVFNSLGDYLLVDKMETDKDLWYVILEK
jgi:hypothetical protein